MSMQFSLGKGLLRAAVALGFFGCLIAQGSLHGAVVAPLTVTTETLADASGGTPDFCGSGFARANHFLGDASRFECFASTMTNQVEIELPDEFGVSFEDEDSIEMFRFDTQQRTVAVDRTMIGTKAAPKIARNTRRSISPPLLV